MKKHINGLLSSDFKICKIREVRREAKILTIELYH